MEKSCNECGIPLTELNWIKVKGKYIRGICRKCRSKQEIKRQAQDIPKRREYMRMYIRRIGRVKQYPCLTCKQLCYKKYAKAFCSDKCRFMHHVQITQTCWLWTGAKKRHGYGMLCFQKSKHATAHRVAYQLFKGPIEEGKLVCHSCDIPACVNPDHLWLGTTQENTKDMKNKGRSLFGEKHSLVKVTESDVIAIRKMNLLGITQVKIAEIFGLTAGHLNNIIKKRVWKHIE